MSVFDRGKDLMGEHSDKIEELAEQGIDKGEEAAGQRFAGHEEHIGMAADKAREMAEGIDGRTDPAPDAQNAPEAGQNG
jgi:hypothetical protein